MLQSYMEKDSRYIRDFTKLLIRDFCANGMLVFWLGKLPTFLSMMRGQYEMTLPLRLTVHIEMLPWGIVLESHTEHENALGTQCM